MGLSKTLKLSIGVLLIDERIHFTNLYSEWSKFYGFLATLMVQANLLAYTKT